MHALYYILDHHNNYTKLAKATKAIITIIQLKTIMVITKTTKNQEKVTYTC